MAARSLRACPGRYPGCHHTRHLKAHHLIPWILGGRTDLENLILLCQWHHTAVHEGGVSISNEPDGWLFTKPDGSPATVGSATRTWPGISTSPGGLCNSRLQSKIN
jgi:HNH endonuclease